MHHSKLTEKERHQISGFIRVGLSPARIARDLERHASTIGRELKRNGTVDRKGRCVAYDAERTARRSAARREQVGGRRVELDKAQRKQIVGGFARAPEPRADLRAAGAAKRRAVRHARAHPRARSVL